MLIVEEDQKQKISDRSWVRKFMIEMVFDAVLLFVYFFLVLRYLDQPLVNLYENNLLQYAIVGIVVISAQAVLLDWVANFFIDLLGLHRLY